MSSSSQNTIPPEPEWVRLVKAQVEGLRFGVVQLVVHDAKVVQVERTEKLRLPSSGLEKEGQAS